MLDRGVDIVFDCRADAASTELGVRLLRAGGTLVVCGRSSRRNAEWSLIWARELTVCGSALYGREHGGRRTFAMVREWLTDPAFPIDGIVTHRFPLDEYNAAIGTANAGVGAGAVKVVFHGPMATLQTRVEGSVAEPDSSPEAPVLLQSTAARVRGRSTT